MLQCNNRKRPHPVIEVWVDQWDQLWWGCDGDDDTEGTIWGDQDVVSSATPFASTEDELLATPEDSRLQFTCPECRDRPVLTERRIREIYDEAIRKNREKARLR